MNSSAEVSRKITFNMLEENDFRLIKSRTYTENESSMIREQLDSQFGNSNGYLDQNEVDAFIASYDDYFEQTNYVLVGDIKIIKQNASLNLSNLVGSTSDNQTIINTTFIFEAKSPHLPEGKEHYIKFHQELWKYVDLDGSGQYTADNNFIFIAPDGWTITYTRGLGNHTFSDNNRTLYANANLEFEWVTVKITENVENNGGANGDNQDSDDNLVLFFIIFAFPTIILCAIIAIVLRGRRNPKTAKTKDDKSEALSDEEIENLELEKKKIKEDILKVRSDLRMDVISKEDAISKEKALKARFKTLDLKLKSAK
jgi:hypothetical protein